MHLDVPILIPKMSNSTPNSQDNIRPSNRYRHFFCDFQFPRKHNLFNLRSQSAEPSVWIYDSYRIIRRSIII